MGVRDIEAYLEKYEMETMFRIPHDRHMFREHYMIEQLNVYNFKE